MKKRRGAAFESPPERGQILCSILVAVGGMVPLASHLSGRVSAFVVSMVMLGLAGLRWPALAPGPLALGLLTLAGGANSLLAYRTLGGQSGGTALFVAMLALKLLELRSRRDLRLVGVLYWFLAAICLLFDRSASIVLYLLCVSVAGVAVQADLNGGMGPNRVAEALKLATRLTVQALPLTAVLFLLFPRLSHPLWDLGLDSRQGSTGMSDRLDPGSIGELVLNGDLAFRARFADRIPAAGSLYWRGLVLWEPDQRGWSGGHPPPSEVQASDRLTLAARPVDYQVLLEPDANQRWLYALDLPIEAGEGAVIGPDFALATNSKVGLPRRYRVRSMLEYRTPDPPETIRQYALRLPPGVTSRMRALVQGWREGAEDDWAVVAKALDFFHREPFSYTLLPPKLGPYPADEFLFETRSGFCEHYASAFALLMRAAGIPARVVVGYLGGEPSRIGRYFSVWQSSAHAWAEVAIPGRGWVRIDPTSAVDPSRVDNSGAARLLGGAAAPARFDLGGGTFREVLRQWRLLADGLDEAWQEWVLNFSASQQHWILEGLGLGTYGEGGLAGLMVLSGSLAMGLVLFRLHWDRRPVDPVQERYLELCRRLTAAGLPRKPMEGPVDYGVRVSGSRPDLASIVSRFLAIYVPARYGPAHGQEAHRQLKGLLKGFTPRPRWTLRGSHKTASASSTLTTGRSLSDTKGGEDLPQ